MGEEVSATLRWRDLGSARDGGRPLSNTLRLLLLAVSYGGGMIVGELLRIIGA
jgi:hypothetical protein